MWRLLLNPLGFEKEKLFFFRLSFTIFADEKVENEDPSQLRSAIKLNTSSFQISGFF